MLNDIAGLTQFDNCKFSGSDYIGGPEEDGFEDDDYAEAILLDILKEDTDHEGKAFPKYI